MSKILHFICPTDGLEATIQNQFYGNHYFITSLANSTSFDKDIQIQIKELINEVNITDIHLVLSQKNRVIKDAIENRKFDSIPELGLFYKKILRESKESEYLWETSRQEKWLISKHLNRQAGKLQMLLDNTRFNNKKIRTLIYNPNDHVFLNTYSQVITDRKLVLN